MNQVIRGMKVKCKSKEVMRECIGLHGMMNDSDIPAGCKNEIPNDELWVREDHCQHNTIDDENIVLHEDVELLLIKKYRMTYAIAHNIATIAGERWKNYQKRLSLSKISYC